MLLCVDLDGVVYRGSEPVPGVGPLLTERVAGGDRVIYVTNNSFLRRVAAPPSSMDQSRSQCGGLMR